MKGSGAGSRNRNGSDLETHINGTSYSFHEEDNGDMADTSQDNTDFAVDGNVDQMNDLENDQYIVYRFLSV